MSTSLKACRLYITPLSPIHIGSGEDYMDTEYIIDDGVLHACDLAKLLQPSPPAWLRRLGETALNIGSNQDASAARQSIRAEFLRHKTELLSLTIRIAAVTPGISRLYQNVTAAVQNTPSYQRPNYRPPQGVLNQLAIKRTIYTSNDQLAYIPGSSLKGALRTAILDQFRNGHPSPTSNNWEKELLGGGFDQDPFSALACGDIMPNACCYTEIGFAINRRRRIPQTNDRNEKGPPQQLETIPAFAARAFQGMLIFNRERFTRITTAPGNFPMQVQQLAAACNNFYQPHFQKEISIFEKRGLDLQWLQQVQALMAEAEPRFKTGKAWICRIGQHSGAECLSLNEWRKIKVMTGKDINTGKMRFEDRKEATTTWFYAADSMQNQGLLPFGWVLIEAVEDGQELPTWPKLEEAAQSFKAGQAKLKTRVLYLQSPPATTNRPTAAKTQDQLEPETRGRIQQIQQTPIKAMSGAVANWHDQWLPRVPAKDRLALRQAMADQLRKWKEKDPKAFETRAQKLSWLKPFLDEVK